MKTKLFTFINGNTEYSCHGVARSSRFGLSLLLKSPAGNWIVANGVNVKSERGFVVDNGICVGDWNHGHYFMESVSKATQYFYAIKEGSVR